MKLMDTQFVQLRKFPRDMVRVAKSKAALAGMSLDDYLTKLLLIALRKTARKDNRNGN
jgi:hypothetical protein